jgi:hypothetical protein
MVTGGSPISTGVIFENNYDRSLSPPHSRCATVGTPVVYDGSIDNEGGDGINPDGLCAPRERAGRDGIEPHERSLIHLLETAQLLEQEQVNLVSLCENIDTSAATGRCFLSMMGAIHQMERELRAERVSAGRASAKARGKTAGGHEPMS